MKILVMNGPNINFLGIREKGIYGEQNYEALVSMIEKKAEELGVDVEVFQSNHEGAIIDKIQEAYKVAQQTLDEVKASMKINYFDDEELIKVQSEKYNPVD